VISRIAVAFLLLRMRENPLDLTPHGVLILVGFLAVVSWLESRRRNEDILLANLGTSPAVVSAVALTTVIVIETALIMAAH
jgi:hypothetical protein